MARRKRKLGQVFLVDRNVLRRIVEAAAPRAGEWVVEIGAGHGHLTEHLLGTGAKVVAFEVDPRLVLELRDRFALLLGDRFFLYDRDYLKVDLQEVFRELGISGKAKLIANIPYYITTPILEKLIGERLFYMDIYLTVQREVAERITARPGTPQYGSLTLFVTYHFEPEILFHISPRSFRPVPRVSSSFLHLKPRPEPPVRVKDPALFFRVIRAAFGNRRKMLRTVLRSLFPQVDLETLERATGISLDRRGETLSMEEFAALSDAFTDRNP